MAVVTGTQALPLSIEPTLARQTRHTTKGAVEDAPENGDWPHQPGTMAVGTHGMAVTAHPLATQAALDILREGGNAIDAVVAAAFTLAVVEPWASGIGGGGFLLFHERMSGETFALDFREHSPLAAHRDMYIRAGEHRPDLSRAGWLAVATPGAVAGLLDASQVWGSLPRERLLQPAIKAAEEGFEVGPHYALAAGGRALNLLRADPEAAGIFLVAGEKPEDPRRPPLVGHILRQEDLARTLSRIAREGRSGFYEGPVAEAIARGSIEGGGLITLSDLATYAPMVREPLVVGFRDLEIYTMPPPSSAGVTLALILGMLERFDLSMNGFDDTRRLHLMAEAMRRAFADRNEHLGDPAFIVSPIRTLKSTAYHAELQRGIDPLQATASASLSPLVTPDPASMADQTSHISVVDAAGNAVALTQTINYTFGAGVVAPGTGVLMNNEMDDFSTGPGQPNLFGLVQGEANAVAPRKIPLSSMSPTIVLRRDESGEGHLHMVLGSPGGPTIISQVAQVIINSHVFRMDIARALAAPRIHHQWIPDRLLVEEGGFSARTIAGLEHLGHRVVTRRGWGNVQAILIDPKSGLLTGSADPRGEGSAEGF